MNVKKKIMIVDDQDFFREGLIVLLNKSKTLEVVAGAGNGKEFLVLAEKHHPDVVLMDINMPSMDGIEATRQAMATNQDLKVIAISMFYDEEQFFKMVRAGAKGFILKSAVVGELEKAILEVSENGNYFSDELRGKIIAGINNQTQNIRESSKVVEALSKEEIDVIRMFVDGFSKEDIAIKLKSTVETVDTHRNNLLGKTSCKNSASFVMFAIKNNLVKVG